MNTCIKHLDKHFIINSRPHICLHLFKTSWPIFYLSTAPLLWFPHGIWISARDLWRHIFMTSFLHRVYDVIFLWRHFFIGFMTSYFCDVISSSGLWRHIFVTSFLHRVYDVIFLWRHFFTGFIHIFVTSFLLRVYDVIFLWRHFFSGFMTSYFCDVISSSGLWRHIFMTSFLHRVYDIIFLYGVAEFFVAKRTNFQSSKQTKNAGGHEWELANALLHVCFTFCASIYCW
jgi:hypothetical protein